MKTATVIMCLILSVALYWHFNRPLPKEHPPEIIALRDFYIQAAKEQPAD